jgi:integrase/recombinase XerC
MKACISISELDLKVSSYLHRLEHIQGYSTHTIRTYTVALKQFMKHVTIECEEDVSFWNIMPFRYAIASQNKKTISKKLSAIRGFQHYLEGQGYTIKIKGDSSVKTPKTLPKPLATSHIFEALKHTNLEETTLVLLLYSCGLRISEVAHLELEHIGSEWIRVRGKGSKVRDVPLIPDVANCIERYREHANPLRFLFEKKHIRFSENSLRCRVVDVFRRIGIKATPHQLRHAYATDLLNNGARIVDVKELLGHTSLGTTEIYTRLASTLKLKNYLNSHPLCKEKHEDY